MAAAAPLDAIQTRRVRRLTSDLPQVRNGYGQVVLAGLSPSVVDLDSDLHRLRVVRSACPRARNVLDSFSPSAPKDADVATVLPDVRGPKDWLAETVATYCWLPDLVQLNEVDFSLTVLYDKRKEVAAKAARDTQYLRRLGVPTEGLDEMFGGGGGGVSISSLLHGKNLELEAEWEQAMEQQEELQARLQALTMEVGRLTCQVIDMNTVPLPAATAAATDGGGDGGGRSAGAEALGLSGAMGGWQRAMDEREGSVGARIQLGQGAGKAASARELTEKEEEGGGGEEEEGEGEDKEQRRAQRLLAVAARRREAAAVAAAVSAAAAAAAAVAAECRAAMLHTRLNCLLGCAVLQAFKGRCVLLELSGWRRVHALRKLSGIRRLTQECLPELIPREVGGGGGSDDRFRADQLVHLRVQATAQLSQHLVLVDIAALVRSHGSAVLTKAPSGLTPGSLTLLRYSHRLAEMAVARAVAEAEADDLRGRASSRKVREAFTQRALDSGVLVDLVIHVLTAAVVEAAKARKELMATRAASAVLLPPSSSTLPSPSLPPSAEAGSSTGTASAEAEAEATGADAAEAGDCVARAANAEADLIEGPQQRQLVPPHAAAAAEAAAAEAAEAAEAEAAAGMAEVDPEMEERESSLVHMQGLLGEAQRQKQEREQRKARRMAAGCVSGARAGGGLGGSDDDVWGGDDCGYGGLDSGPDWWSTLASFLWDVDNWGARPCLWGSEASSSSSSSSSASSAGARALMGGLRNVSTQRELLEAWRRRAEEDGGERLRNTAQADMRDLQCRLQERRPLACLGSVSMAVALRHLVMTENMIVLQPTAIRGPRWPGVADENGAGAAPGATTQDPHCPPPGVEACVLLQPLGTAGAFFASDPIKVGSLLRDSGRQPSSRAGLVAALCKSLDECSTCWLDCRKAEEVEAALLAVSQVRTTRVVGRQEADLGVMVQMDKEELRSAPAIMARRGQTHPDSFKHSTLGCLQLVVVEVSAVLEDVVKLKPPALSRNRVAALEKNRRK